MSLSPTLSPTIQQQLYRKSIKNKFLCIWCWLCIVNVHLIHIKYDLTKILNRWCCLSSDDYHVYKRTLCHMGRYIFYTYSCSDRTSIATAAAEETEKSIHYSFAPHTHTHTHTLKVCTYRCPILYYILYYIMPVLRV